MRCPDDGGELTQLGQSVFGCPHCRGRAFQASAFASAHPGVAGLLRPEGELASGAYARIRSCPSCQRPMSPLRLGQLEAWLDWCETCRLLWEEKLDEAVIEELKRRMSRDRAVSSMKPAERQAMAREIAGELASYRREAEVIEALRCWLLYALSGWW